jgi:signal transduction histidine kinase
LPDTRNEKDRIRYRVIEPRSAGVGAIRFRTWPVVALALLGLLGLIFVSILAVRSKADAAYAELDDLNTRYLNIETRLRHVRSNLHLSGILVRDYLLDTNAPTAEYRSRLMELRTESARAVEELRPLVRNSDPVRYDTLHRELDEYWKRYTPLFGDVPFDDRYGLLRREVVPRRDAVMAMSAEIESINNANLVAQREAAAVRQRQLHRYLTQTLVTSLTLGLAVAVAAVIRIRVLERRSEQQHTRTLLAEQEMRRLSNQLVKTQEEERKLLSRELHDELGQMLTALRMEVGHAERAHAVGSPAFAATVAESKSLIERMMRLVRDLAMGLRPSMLDDLGLAPALAWQTRDFARRYNVPVNLNVEGDLERLPDPHRTCVFRVVQEALTNCAKHSAATKIEISLVGGADRLDVSVDDNGVGLRPATGHTGFGLTGIKERVKEMEGSVTIQTKPGGGTVLHITLPIPAASGSKEPGLAHSAR